MPHSQPQPLADRMTALFDHLGIQRAHIAARIASDCQEFAQQNPTAVASLSLLCPPYLDLQALQPFADRLYVMTGDQVTFNAQIAQAMAKFSGAVHHELPDVNTAMWTDIANDDNTISALDTCTLSPSQHHDCPHHFPRNVTKV